MAGLDASDTSTPESQATNKGLPSSEVMTNAAMQLEPMSHTSEQRIVELTHQLSERDRSIQTLLEHVQNSERVIGTYAAEVIDRDQRILLLEQRLSQSRWHILLIRKPSALYAGRRNLRHGGAVGGSDTSY